MDTGERLIQLGFTFAGTCNCNGSPNRKYKRAEYLVYVTKTKFKVKRHGSTIKGYSDIEGLAEYLQATFPKLPFGEQVQGGASI